MAVNDFKPYATGAGANVMSQAGYEADPALTDGVLSGTAVSALYNKTARQGNFIAAVVAQMIVDQLAVDMLDDGDLSGKVTLLQNAILELTSIYAPLASPALTGNPTAPTQSPGNDSTRLATTAFVTAAITVLNAALTAAINLKAPLASPGFSGTPTTPTPASASDSSTKIPNTSWVNTFIANYLATWQTTNVPVYGSVYGTGQVSITLGTQQTYSHGLSSTNLVPWVYLVCQSADGSFSVGDVVACPSYWINSSQGHNIGVHWTSTQLKVTMPNFGITLWDSAGAPDAIDVSKWKYLVVLAKHR